MAIDLVPQTGLPEQDLRRSERRVYSQNGEDGIIQEVLRRIGLSTRCFVEFGVEDGGECNCARLALEEGFSGLFMEAAAEPFARLRERFADCPAVQCVQAHVRPDNIQRLLAEAAVPREFDVLSIDVDGQDFYIWRAIVDWSPRLVVIEYNAQKPPPERWVMIENAAHRWDGTDYYGAALASLTALGRSKGYELVCCDSNGVNAFFVRRDLIDAQFLDPVVQYHYRPLRHGVDGAGHPHRIGPGVAL